MTIYGQFYLQIAHRNKLIYMTFLRSLQTFNLNEIEKLIMNAEKLQSKDLDNDFDSFIYQEILDLS
ncbi:hypothetical protein BpHYR1_004769 [Brachionus plicatilis]|uniref:Uncharacterized protein n=1 Tax=Brachionus plicatilis TaxID=10195 RepID=A0A3M7SZL9_BRAPC|nr:hypothetical protein BpHYR1_004769 [Brachionus plicatilis]